MTGEARAQGTWGLGWHSEGSPACTCEGLASPRQGAWFHPKVQGQMKGDHTFQRSDQRARANPRQLRKARGHSVGWTAPSHTCRVLRGERGACEPQRQASTEHAAAFVIYGLRDELVQQGRTCPL